MLNLLTTSLTAALLFAVNAAGSVILARLLGPSGRGEYALLILVAGMVVSLTSPGLGVALVYYLGGGKEEPGKVVSSALMMAVILGAASAAVVLSLAAAFPEVIPQGLRFTLLVPVLVSAPLMIATRIFLRVLQARQSLLRLNLASLVGAGSLLVYYGIFLLWLRMGVVGAVVSFILGTVTTLAVGYFLSRNLWGFSLSFDRALIGRMLVFGLKGHVANILQFMNWRLDAFILAWFLGTAGVGYYAVAVALSEILWLLPDAFATVLLPKTASTNDRDGNAYSSALSRHTVFLSLLGGGFLAIIGKPIISLAYGEVFLPSLIPLLILLPGSVAFGVVRVLNNFFIGRGFPLLSSYAAGLSLLLSIGLDLVLIPTYGIVGAAVAATVAYSATCGFVLWQYRRISGATLRRTLVLEPSDFRSYRAASRLAVKTAGSAIHQFLA